MALLESLSRMFPLLKLNDSALSLIIEFRDQIATTNVGMYVLPIYVKVTCGIEALDYLVKQH